MKEDLLKDIEHLKAMEKYVLDTRISICTLSVEIRPSEHDTINEVNNILCDFSETLKIIVNRKERALEEMQFFEDYEDEE